jgi:putative hydrolase of the HAD superfamily
VSAARSGPPTSSDTPRRDRALRAVTLDAAGTLIHPVRPVGELYAEVAARHGVQVAPVEVHRRFRDAFGAAPPLAFPPLDPEALRAAEKAWWRAVVARVFTGIPFPDFDAYFDELFAFFARPSTWTLDPDTLPLLRGLRDRRLGIVVVSNFDSRVRGILTGLGLMPLFDRLTLSSEAGAAKPDPAIFAAALAPEGLAPAEVVHVGDTVREDFAGARAAGVAHVILVGAAALAADAPGAHVVTRLADVTPIIDALATSR